MTYACAWTALLPPRAEKPALRGQVDCHVAVIGAGLVGLAAARRLAELAPNETVVVLEASSVGAGSAGRNSGFVIDVPLSHAMGTGSSLGDVEPAQLVLSRQAYAWLEEIVRTEAIDCGWRRTGRYYAAATGRGVAALDGLVRQFKALGEPAERVAEASLRRLLGTDYYREAVFNPSCTLVQPAALIRGLADALPATVLLHENSPVTDWRSEGDVQVLTTPGGSVRARRTIWATHTDVRRFSPLGKRYMRLFTYAGLTPVLSDDELGQGSLAEWGVLPAVRAGSTVRRVADGRVLIRSLWSYEQELEPSEVERRLLPLLQARFPRAAPKGFEFTWGGAISVTRDAQPWLGEFRPGAYAFAGCNGSGIVKGSAYGRLLAELALDQRSDALALAMRQPTAAWIPPEPVRRIAAAFTLARNERQAAAEI